jgi:hypothetical protein
MTRNSKLALVTLLAGLLSLVSVATVNADSPCTGYAQEHCEQMAAMNDVALFSVTTPAHGLDARGIGQEHYEEIMAARVATN